MTWATKRKIQYLSVLFLILFIILAWILIPIIFKEPTCFDGKKNGDETGVDCGGSCALVCINDAISPVVIWSRALPVLDNNYNLIALVENKNKDSAIRKISYEFKMYDMENKLIGRREGNTYLPANERFAIFEPRFNSGSAVVKSTYFEFKESFVWEKKPPAIQSLPVKIDRIILENKEQAPVLNARITNDSVFNLPSFEVVAIVYNVEGNAIGVSNTTKSGISSGESNSLVFTWPEPFSEEPVNYDVLLKINPFSINF